MTETKILVNGTARSLFFKTSAPPKIKILQFIADKLSNSCYAGTPFITENPNNIIGRMEEVIQFAFNVEKDPAYATFQSMIRVNQKTIKSDITNYLIEHGAIIITTNNDMKYVYDADQMNKIIQAAMTKIKPSLNSDRQTRLDNVLKNYNPSVSDIKPVEIKQPPKQQESIQLMHPDLTCSLIQKRLLDRMEKFTRAYPKVKQLCNSIGSLCQQAKASNPDRIEKSVEFIVSAFDALLDEIETHTIENVESAYVDETKTLQGLREELIARQKEITEAERKLAEQVTTPAIVINTNTDNAKNDANVRLQIFLQESLAKYDPLIKALTQKIHSLHRASHDINNDLQPLESMIDDLKINLKFAKQASNAESVAKLNDAIARTENYVFLLKEQLSDVNEKVNVLMEVKNTIEPVSIALDQVQDYLRLGQECDWTLEKIRAVAEPKLFEIDFDSLSNWEQAWLEDVQPAPEIILEKILEPVIAIEEVTTIKVPEAKNSEAAEDNSFDGNFENLNTLQSKIIAAYAAASNICTTSLNGTKKVRARTVPKIINALKDIGLLENPMHRDEQKVIFDFCMKNSEIDDHDAKTILLYKSKRTQMGPVFYLNPKFSPSLIWLTKILGRSGAESIQAFLQGSDANYK